MHRCCYSAYGSCAIPATRWWLPIGTQPTASWCVRACVCWSIFFPKADKIFVRESFWNRRLLKANVSGGTSLTTSRPTTQVVLEGRVSLNLPQGRFDVQSSRPTLAILSRGDSIGDASARDTRTLRLTCRVACKRAQDSLAIISQADRGSFECLREIPARWRQAAAKREFMSPRLYSTYKQRSRLQYTHEHTCTTGKPP